MTAALEAPLRLLQLQAVTKKLFELRNVKIHRIMKICNRYFDNENIEECFKDFDEIQELIKNKKGCD